MASSKIRSALFVSSLLALSVFNVNAAVTSPEPGIPLAPDTITVEWESTAPEYWVRVSDLADGEIVYDSGRLSAETLSVTFTVTPDIIDIDITFYEKINGDWESSSQLHDVSGEFEPPIDPPPPMAPEGVALASFFAICNDSLDGDAFNEGYFCAADCPEDFLAIALDTPSYNNGIDGSAYSVEGFGTPTIAVYPLPDTEVQSGEIINIETRYYYTCIRGYVDNGGS